MHSHFCHEIAFWDVFVLRGRVTHCIYQSARQKAIDLGNLAVGVAMQDKQAVTEPTEACRELQGMRGSAKLVEIPDTEQTKQLNLEEKAA